MKKVMDLASIYDTLSGLVEVKDPVKASIIEVRRYVVRNNLFADFTSQFSRFANITNVFSEPVVACHALDTPQHEHRVRFCSVDPKVVRTCSLMSK